MGTFSLVLCIGAANGFVLAAMLLLAPTQDRTAHRVLAALIASLSWRAGTYILGYMGAYDAHPWLTFFPFDLSLAYGPLLWFYVVRLTCPHLPPRWHRHLIPAAVQLFYYLACFSLPQDAKWAWYSGAHLHLVAPFGAAIALMSALYYLHRSMRWSWEYRAWLDARFANREEARLGDLRWLLGCFAVALLVAAGFAVTSWFLVPLRYRARFPLMVVFAVLTYALGILGWRNTGVSFPPWRAVSPEAERPSPSPPDSGGESEVEAAFKRREHGRCIAAAVEASDWWRDEDLDLEALSGHLGVSPRTLSRTLSEGLATSFREFVGRIRVAAVAAEFDAGSRRPILDVALDAGFKSKASFNRAFLAYKGVTPSAYRKAVSDGGLTTRQMPSEAAGEATQ